MGSHQFNGVQTACFPRSMFFSTGNDQWHWNSTEWNSCFCCERQKKRIYMLLTGLKISMNFGPIFGVGLFSVLFKAKQQKLGSGRVHNAPSDLLTHQHAVFGYWNIGSLKVLVMFHLQMEWYALGWSTPISKNMSLAYCSRWFVSFRVCVDTGCLLNVLCLQRILWISHWLNMNSVLKQYLNFNCVYTWLLLHIRLGKIPILP